LVKLLSDLCETKASGSRYDRFFVAEFQKKLKTMPLMEEMYSRLRDAADAVFLKTLEDFIVESS
jgi:hypothetical protein